MKNHLKSLQTSLDLALPLGVSNALGDEAKLQEGMKETAKRALEVAIIQTGEDYDRGKSFANDFAKITGAIPGSIWEYGVQTATRLLSEGTSSSTFVS